MTKLTVTTAKALSAEKRSALEKEFFTKYGDCSVDYVVNDEIVGGIIVFDGDKVYDGSVAKQLDVLRERIKGTKQ